MEQLNGGICKRGICKRGVSTEVGVMVMVRVLLLSESG